MLIRHGQFVDLAGSADVCPRNVRQSRLGRPDLNWITWPGIEA